MNFLSTNRITDTRFAGKISARQLREQTAPVNAGAAAEAAGANTLVSVKTAAESGRGTAKAGGKVHLNTATAAELTALPGVGDITAQRILEYRAAHGFTSIEAKSMAYTNFGLFF